MDVIIMVIIRNKIYLVLKYQIYKRDSIAARILNNDIDFEIVSK
jgi:hypothetical protein